ncbi:hypothetical protein WUBG_07422 [Wuchereria bancrofti]|uniref:BPTI/Kunitz inhibitor domain-containing protein n=1 Tax=Wuchereria bancrofti TaxID=6293 RepID=J9F2W9_WUCBA|nr:hypothetical protein WUBG_07422 [Wuchereria bancrofti]
MSYSLWYTLLSACASVISHGEPNFLQHIVIQTGCFNIYRPCPERYRSRQNNLPSTISPLSVITRRLLIRTNYIDDLTTTTVSLTHPSTTATTISSPPLPSETVPSKMTATTPTTSIAVATLETTRITDTAPLTALATLEIPLSSSPGYGKDINPCKYGESAKGFNQRPLMCSRSNSMACPKGFFCHIGASRAETVCCERSGLADPCSLPVEEGEGNARLERYYYDYNSKNCQQFIYRGVRGNENSFGTYEECRHECMRWDLICQISPKASEHRSCSVNRRECGDKQWCHIGTSSYSSLCCAGSL